MVKLKKDGTPSKQGEGGGKPPKFKTGEDIEKAAIGYIEFLIARDDSLPHPMGVKITDMPTKSGLRIWLDISSQTYSEYKKKYPDALKRVENIIEDTWVQKLAGQNVTGSIFYLKNAFSVDYRDRTETDITSGGKVIPILSGITKKNEKEKKDNS